MEPEIEHDENEPRVERMARAERLKQAREGAGYKTMTDVANFLGWKEVAYRKHETGERGLPIWKIMPFAAALKCDPGWLAFGDYGRSAPPVIGQDHWVAVDAWAAVEGGQVIVVARSATPGE